MQIIKTNKLCDFFKVNQINVFIASASFENRCFALIDGLQNLEFNKSIVCRTIDFDPKIIENSKLFLQKLKTDNSLIIDLKIGDPTFSFLQLVENIVPLFSGESKKIALDITTFTHEGLLIIFRILVAHKREGDHLFFCYNGAKEYSHNETEQENKWLTKGVREVRSVIGFPGYSNPSLKNHLIILFGFERERTIRLIEEYEYDVVSLAFGDKQKSIQSSHQQINEDRHREIIGLYSSAQKFNISLTNPEITKQEILNYVSKFEGYNVVLAPMNNKLSTIGAGLASLENPNIQLCYMQANQYNLEGYSEAGDDFYIWSI